MRSKYLNVPTHRGKASKNATFESVTSMLLDSLGIFYCKKYTCTTLIFGETDSIEMIKFWIEIRVSKGTEVSLPQVQLL